mmetsp:Transcript_44091/g.114212  ORF Transcript_44091/g.114212 Transcript_44091/m.114212 type:complete len:170 (+) Transcript_44091:192-701(+)
MSEAAVGVRPALSSDEWEAVAEQLIGAEDGTWRGVLRCVCRASRDGVDGATATVQGGRRMDPRVLAARGGEGDEVEELLAKQAGLLVFPLRGFRPLQGRSGCNPSDCTLLAGSVAWGCLVVACGRHGHTGFGQTKDEASEDQDQALRKNGVAMMIGDIEWDSEGSQSTI